MGVSINDLIGVTMKSVTRAKINNEEDDELHFEAEDGRKWKLYHEQDCCESVEIVDICGNLSDLEGSPIQMAEVVSNENKTPEGVSLPSESYADESYTWTFYKFATIKGYVTIRWLGESNGYYSEEVDFAEMSV